MARLSSRSRIRRRRLWLEPLEARTLLAASPFADAIVLPPGGTTIAVLQVGHIDTYQVTLTDTARLTSRVTGVLSRLGLYGPDGALLVQSDGVSAADPNPRLTQYLTAGTYYLRIEGVGTATGSYTLTTDATPAAPYSWQDSPSNYGDYFDGGLDVASVVADFNEDGVPDVMKAQARSLTPTPVYATDFTKTIVSVEFLLGLGDGQFGRSSVFFPPNEIGSISSLFARDFNRDGHLDLLMVTAVGEGSILFGRGNGTFDAQQDAQGKARARPVFSVRSNEKKNIVRATVGDFNRDGNLDVAMSSTADSQVIILNGRGDGTFADPVRIAFPGLKPYNIAAGDFNGDGWLDLATPSAPL